MDSQHRQPYNPEKTQDPYIHDCPQCEWVGWISGQKLAKNGLGNIYIHRKEDGIIDVIVRDGDEPSNYRSWSTNDPFPKAPAPTGWE